VRPGVLRYADIALLSFGVLYVAAAASVGWQIGRDWPAVGVLGFLVVPLGGLACWVLGVGQVIRVLIWDRRHGRRRVVCALAVTAALGLSPLVAGLLNTACREAGARYQFGIADLEQVRRDCTLLVQAHQGSARSTVIHVDNPAFGALPASVRRLNPLMVRITADYVEVIRYGMIARRRGFLVVPEDGSYRPQHGEREIAPGIYRLE